MEQTSAPEVIQPEFTKAFLVAFISFFIPVIAVFALVLALNIFVDLSFILEILKLLQINATMKGVILKCSLWAFIAVLAVSVINSIYPLLSRIDVYEHKLVIKKGFSADELMFDTIVKINYDQKGMAKKFNYGEIIIEASGTKIGSYKLNYISSIESTVQKLQNKLVKYRYDTQDKVRVRHIMEGF